MSRVPATATNTDSSMEKYYRALTAPPLSFGSEERLKELGVEVLASEHCFNVSLTAPLSDEDERVLGYLFTETFEPSLCGRDSFLASPLAAAEAEDAAAVAEQRRKIRVVEVGPRLQFRTPWATNAVTVCQSCGLTQVDRIEVTRRFLARGADAAALDSFSALVHDRMTEADYSTVGGLNSFESANKQREKWFRVPVLEQGETALRSFSNENGLGFDEQDLKYYSWLFRDDLKRDPTNVELFDLAQGNSEHSRHWFFGGLMVIDGVPQDASLFKLVKRPYETTDKSLSTVAFADNSSAQRGRSTPMFLPDRTRVGPGRFAPIDKDLDVTFTCETHNFPCGIAPLPGAETGSGGRLRDQETTGRGSLVQAGIAGYSVGNLHLPGYTMPWERDERLQEYPSNMAQPMEILVSASDGASDYGNKFGEPLLAGFVRTFGAVVGGDASDGASEDDSDTTVRERIEWIKPIMLSGGVGRMDHAHIKKETPRPGQNIVKLGGPAYRIGVGGGAASSMVSGDNKAELDFNAVQRADAEMLQRVDRVVRTCVEMGDSNPITSIHDQGAGGSGNVLKEICEPMGADIDTRNMLIGDPTMSTLELWIAEYQENDCLLIDDENLPTFRAICERECAPFSVVGRVTDSGIIRVVDAEGSGPDGDSGLPVDLPLERVLGKMPRKTFELETVAPPSGVSGTAEHLAKVVSSPRALLRDVLRLASVGCKRYLTSKVDRSVGGLVAQQQCVGPRHLPLANVAVVAESFLDKWGAAVSIGEQPLKAVSGDIDDMRRMARLTVAEALTNMSAVKIRGRDTIKASGNWMWASKLRGEGAKMYACCEALSEVLCETGIVIDGGKDSLSMAARLPAGVGGRTKAETVKCPGTLVMSCYAVVDDVTQKVTPDLKAAGNRLIFLDLGRDRHMLAGTALAQVTGGVLRGCADADVAALKHGFDAIQDIVATGTARAVHDVSDGGLVTTVLEMAFAADGLGVDVALPWASTAENGSDDARVLTALFAEAPGVVVEVRADDEASTMAALVEAVGSERVHALGCVTSNDRARIRVGGGAPVLDESVGALRAEWDETAYQLEKQQCAPACVESEREATLGSMRPQYRLTYEPSAGAAVGQRGHGPKVAIIREEGSNGDREMASCFDMAGFETWDVTMSDLTEGRVSLAEFRGCAFVGGFSFADTFDSAKGWAAKVLFNPKLKQEFDSFFARPDTFSLGCCNGCQLMALLGVIARPDPVDKRVRFVHNNSGRFESRFSTLVVDERAAARSMWTQGMGGSVLGVWVAHGEGRAHFPDAATHAHAEASGLIPFRYADDAGLATERYPMNPNGSPGGIAGLTSVDGRHLAMMPHPERLGQKWNWPWMPDDWAGLAASPWARLFQNARTWCARYDAERAALYPAVSTSVPILSRCAPGRARLAVLVSGSGTTLQHLLDESGAGHLAADVAVVVASKASAGALARAAKAGVPAAVVASKTFRNAETKKTDWAAMSAAVYEAIAPHNVDLVVLAGYMCLLEVPPAWTNRVVNVHPALIPAFCGQGMYGDHVHRAVVEKGARVTGCTVHFADNEYDSGPIIAQATVGVTSDDTVDTVRAKVQRLEKSTLVGALNDLAAGLVAVDSTTGRISFNRAAALRRKIRSEGYLDYVVDRIALPELGTPARGKVRDVYTKDDKVVMLTSDRVSSFDFVLPNLIPFKGFVLNAVSKHLMMQTADIVPNALGAAGPQPDPLVVVQQRMRNIGVECVVRGYLWGSMASAYEGGAREFCGQPLPEGLVRYQKLERPLFTPTTKAEQGEHDAPMTPTEVAELLGPERAAEVERVSLALFERGSQLLRERGLVLIDTKYEFGLDEKGTLHVIDEVNTPDSSRMCTVEEYESKWPKVDEAMRAGSAASVSALVSGPRKDLKIAELSKQYVRDCLLDMGFDGTGAIALTEDMVVECSARYVELYERIVGDDFPWPTTAQATPDAQTSRVVAGLRAAGLLGAAGGVAVIVAAGGEADTLDQVAAIVEAHAAFGVPCLARVCSPVHQPAALQRLVAEYNASAQPLAFVTVGSAVDSQNEALAAAVAARSVWPVVRCDVPGGGAGRINPLGTATSTASAGSSPVAIAAAAADAALFTVRAVAGGRGPAADELRRRQVAAAADVAEADLKARAFPLGTASANGDDGGDDDKPKHECGITVLRLLKPLEYYRQKYGTEAVGLDLMYFLMEKMRNRGQDGAGLASIKLDAQPGDPYNDVLRSSAKDAIGDLFQNAERLRSSARNGFLGEVFLGHVRYGTHGGNAVENLHPFERNSNWRSRSALLAGNFNLTNVDELFEDLVAKGMHPLAMLDTVTCLEHIGHFLDEENNCHNVRLSAAGHKPRRRQQLVQESIDVARVLRRAAADWDGGFAMAGLLGHGDAFVMRDRHGIRPAFWWANEEFCVCSSEMGAIGAVFDAARFEDIREIRPGHALIIRKSGKIFEERVLPAVSSPSACVFERIYFSRPNDPHIYRERKALGRELVAPVLDHLQGENDVSDSVISFVPNTSEIACTGFVEEMRRVLNARGDVMMKVDKLITKDTKLRTFIQEDNTRAQMSRHAYDYTPGVIKEGRSIVVAIDDSVVRGTTLKQSIIKRLDRLGPRKIIFVSSAPPICFPDVYGIDMSRLDNLIAFQGAISVIKEREADDGARFLKDVYTDCKKALAAEVDGTPLVNHVKRIYDTMTAEQLSAKISEMVSNKGTTNAEVQVVYQTVEGMRRAIPDHTGDWVFTGDFPTPGGVRCALRAFVNYFEGLAIRSYPSARSLALGAKIVVVGSGGREHALAWKLAKSEKVREVFVAPGNAGTASSEDLRVSNVNISLDKNNGFASFVSFCREHHIDLVVVGPEQPLVDGISDALQAAGIDVFGPTRAAAELEASKAWSKIFFEKYGVPSSPYRIFESPMPSSMSPGGSMDETEKELEAFVDQNWPVVVKASGLCAGKGVIIPEDKAEAVAACTEMLSGGKFGTAGQQVVVEKMLTGREISIFGLSDGTGTVRMLPPAQDHKRALDGDEGLNTGGMGAYCPAPADESVLDFVRRRVFEPTAKGMLDEGRPFVGVLYAGLMFAEKGNEDPETLHVLEFNCRFGDPETQAVLPVLDVDLYLLLKSCATGTLAGFAPEDNLYHTSKHAACVVVASGGYPLAYEKGKVITGLDSVEDVPGAEVFHAGTSCTEVSPDALSVVRTSGGRVLAVSAVANCLEDAVKHAYVGVRLINFDGAFYRSDIAAKAVKAERGSSVGIDVDGVSNPLALGIAKNATDEDDWSDESPTPAALTYLAAGVDIDAGDLLVETIKPVVKATSRPGCEMDGSLSFGGFCDLARCKYEDPILVSGTDGVGTKLKVAGTMQKHDTIGIDLVAMCVNDCLVHGAEPLFFLDYFATGKLEVSQAVAVVKGVAEGCKQSGCALIGGETAEMPGMYAKGDYDVAGFSVGAVERRDVLPRMDQIAPGDVIIGVASSGVHSNGLSLVRRIIEGAINPETGSNYSLFDPAPFDETLTLGDAILTPTKIYVKSLLPVIKSGRVSAAAHITGGGLYENIPRVLPDNLAVELDAMRWRFPPIFRWLMEAGGNVAATEMARTFNCGVGMVLVVKPEDADGVIADIKSAGEDAFNIGHIKPLGDRKRQVEIKNCESAWKKRGTPSNSPTMGAPRSPSRILHSLQ